MLVKNPISKKIKEIKKIWIAAPVAVIGLGTIAYIVLRRRSKMNELPPSIIPPSSFKNVPFASLQGPSWPLLSEHPKGKIVSYRTKDGGYIGNYSRRFGAARESDEGKDRWHVGVDLYANHLDPVVAMSDGVVVGVQKFHLGTDAIFVDHGPVVVMYGEVESGSWKNYGVGNGTRVSKGQKIAHVGCMSWRDGKCRSHMLHLETYTPGTTKNSRWYQGDPAPRSVLDPTELLLKATS